MLLTCNNSSLAPQLDSSNLSSPLDGFCWAGLSKSVTVWSGGGH